VSTPFASIFWQTFMVTPTSEDLLPGAPPAEAAQAAAANPPPEIGGREGPEPTRFGDWELRGRCIDF
jgi:hypothetical protein